MFDTRVDDSGEPLPGKAALADGGTLYLHGIDRLSSSAQASLLTFLREAAEALEITLHPEALERAGGTEVFAVQVSRDGIPTALLSIPLRNMHSPVEVVALRDIERAGRLMAGFIAGLDETTIDRLTLD